MLNAAPVQPVQEPVQQVQEPVQPVQEPVQQPAKICPNCGTTNADVPFCVNCGMMLQQPVSQTSEHLICTPPEYRPPVPPEPNYFQQPPVEAHKAPKAKKEGGKKGKKGLVFAIIAVLLVVALIVIFVFVPMMKKSGSSRNIKSLYYAKENEVYGTTIGKKIAKGTMYTDELYSSSSDFDASSQYYLMAPMEIDGRVYYSAEADYYDNYTLMCKAKGNAKAEEKEIASNVMKSYVLKNGKVIYRTSGDDLYLYVNEERTEIDNNVYIFIVDANEKYVFWYNDEYDLFYMNIAKDKEGTKLASNVDNFNISEDGKTIFYTKDSKLYIIEKFGEKEKLAQEIYTWSYASADSKTIIWSTDTGEYNEDDYTTIYDYTMYQDGKIIDLELDMNVSSLYYDADSEKLFALEYTGSDDNWNSLYTIYSYDCSDGKQGKEVEIETDVQYFVGIADGKAYYVKDIVNDANGTPSADLYCDDKKIASDIYPYGIQMDEDRSVLGYYTDYDYDYYSGTLHIIQLSDLKDTEIAEDIYSYEIRSASNIVMLQDYSMEYSEGDLVVYTGGKSIQKVDTDVRFFYPAVSYNFM